MPSSTPAQRQFRRALTWAVVIPPVVALALAAVFLWQIIRLLDQQRWVSHTDQVIREGHATEALLLRMQASVRGFLLSGDQHFLRKYEEADAGVAKAAGSLVQLVADNPAQVAQAQRVVALVERSRGVSKRLVTMRGSGEDYQSYIGNPEYKSLLDERDRLFREFVAAEETLRERRSKRSSHTAWTVILVSLGLASAGGVGMGLAARRTLVRLSGTYRDALASVERARDELEHRVEERTAQLQDVVGQLEAFSYTVSHDLRAPLRAMQGFSQALVEDYAEGLDPKGRMYVQRIAAAAERMDGMIQDLLDYSRLSRSHLTLGPVDLDAVVGEAMEQVGGDQRANVTADRPFPPVLGHAPTLVRVIANLLSNALKYAAPDRPPEVRVAATETGGRIRLWVEDNGIGIAPEHHARIFNVFERLHGSEEYPGTGIGLAVVRRAAERMGGSCGVESEPDKGSRFWVELSKAETEGAGTKAVDQWALKTT